MAIKNALLGAFSVLKQKKKKEEKTAQTTKEPVKKANNTKNIAKSLVVGGANKQAKSAISGATIRNKTVNNAVKGSVNSTLTNKPTNQKRSIKTVDVYERGGRYYYKDENKEHEVNRKFMQNAIKNNRTGVIGRYDSRGRLKETNENGIVKTAKGIRREKVNNLKKQVSAMGDNIKSGKTNVSQAITDVANIADAATDFGPGKLYKTAAKNRINALDRLWTGSTKTLENVWDTANDLTSGITSRQNYLINRASGMSKKDALKEMEEEQKANAEWVSRDLVNDFKDKTGYNNIQPSLEEGSIVKRDNLVGKTLEGVGGMLPSLAVGQYANLGLASKSLEGLSGLQKAGAVAGNLGRAFVNQAGANTVLGASSYGSGLEEAYKNGATGKQARMYGLLNAATELATEWITGGIPGTKSEGVLDDIVENLIDKKTAKISNKYVSNVVNAIVKGQARGIGEGIEEGLAEIISPYIKNLTYSNGEKVNWNDVKESTLTGYLVGMFLNTPESVSELKQGINEAKIETARKQQLLNEIDQMVAEAKTYTPEQQQQANEIAQRVESGEIDIQEGNALLEQVKDGTYQQNRNLEQIATQESQRLQQAAQQGIISQEEYTQGLQTLTNTVNQTREEINTPQQQVQEQNVENNNEIKQVENKSDLKEVVDEDKYNVDIKDVENQIYRENYKLNEDVNDEDGPVGNYWDIDDTYFKLKDGNTLWITTPTEYGKLKNGKTNYNDEIHNEIKMFIEDADGKVIDEYNLTNEKGEFSREDVLNGIKQLTYDDSNKQPEGQIDMFGNVHVSKKSNNIETNQVENNSTIEVKDNKINIKSDILANVEPKNWTKTIKQFIKNKFSNGINVDGKNVGVTNKSINELIGSRYTKWLRRNNIDIYQDKMRMIDGLEEIYQNQQNQKIEDPNHPRKDDIIAFKRGNVEVEVGNNKYDAEVLTGIRENTKEIVYDIVNIEKEGSPSGVTPRKGEPSSVNNIQQNNQNVNIPAKANDTVITIKNDNLNNVPKDKIKGEDTGVSIDGKQVHMQIPIDSKPNKLGQYVPKDGFTQKELDSGKLGDSHFYKNVTERADFINDKVREKIKNDDYLKHYRKVTNKESMREAFNDLNTRGTEAIADFFNNDKELTAKDTAMGWLLIAQSQENGDYDFSNQVLKKMRSNATKTGQTMQMYNYYARLTPEGMYRWCGDQLLRAEEIFEKNKTKKWIEANKKRWQLNAEETNFIKSQMQRIQELNQMNDNDTTTIDVKGKTKQVTVDRAKQVEIAKIQAMIENKIPPTKGQALNAWMRISMLGNLKTIGTRNPLGNIALRPVNDVGDLFASVADFAISKATGVRTKGNFNPIAQAKGVKKGVSETFQDTRLGINTKDAKGNRFEIGEGKSFNDKHTGVARLLNPAAKLGNKLDSGVSFLLDLGDRPFYEASYKQSLENQMKLNGIEKLEDVPDWMKNNAEQEALERTYQDDNSYTQSVIAIRKAMNNLNVKGYGLGDVIIPFAKTPANLTKAIVDYSPAGFVNAITKGNDLRKSIQNGQFTPEMQHTFVNQLGKATAGTILYAIGAALANSGLITGGADEDKDVADFMRNTLGIQPYSIKIGNKSYTYDWAQPLASGLAIPADIKKAIDDAKEGEVDLEYIIHKAFNTAGSVLLEQSFLQGIKDVLGGYGDPLENLLSEIEGLPARAIPTLLQQIVTYLDGTKRMSYGNKGFENMKAQAQAKTPWAKYLPVYRNSLGKEIKMYGGKNTFFNVFINPANYSQGNATESANEIYRVYQATNDKDILPRLVDSSLKDEDGKKLTNQQKSDFLKISGDIIEKNIDELRKEKKYQKLSDEEKADKIKSIVNYSYNKARKEITGHKLSGANKSAEQASEAGYSIADYFLDKTKTTKKKSKERNRYQELKKVGIDGKTYTKFKNFANSDKARGESRTGGLTKKQKIRNYIQSLPLSAKQKEALWKDYNENQIFITLYS